MFGAVAVTKLEEEVDEQPSGQLHTYMTDS